MDARGLKKTVLNGDKMDGKNRRGKKPKVNFSNIAWCGGEWEGVGVVVVLAQGGGWGGVGWGGGLTLCRRSAQLWRFVTTGATAEEYRYQT